VRIFKKPAKNYISIQLGMKLRKTSIFGDELSFTLPFLFHESAEAYSLVHFQAFIAVS
jgi:hypothetical protein